MLTEANEQVLSNARRNSAKHRQDKTIPHVVNIHDGRLMPNNQMLREHKDYRVYTGPKDASVEERLRWVQGEVRRAPRVVNTTPEEEAFDVGKATRDDLITFAMDEYGHALDPALPLTKMRAKVVELAQKAAGEGGDLT